jgi:predicted ATPase/DNA-binding XRE family transcriptional regulator
VQVRAPAQPAALSFAAQLRALRHSAGLSQDELANRAHLTTHAVSALERGIRTRPFPSTVRALADALNASEDERAALFAAVPSRHPVDRTAGTESSAVSHRLPTPSTALLAREQETADLVTLLHDPDARLITLTGVGGVGKTRLCLAAASAVESAFRDGVAFVALASLLDADLVLPAIAEAVGATKQAGGDAQGLLITHLRDRHMLVVLDNFEHVLGAAPYVAGLLEDCPGLKLLVSSRAALRVRGEKEFRIQPLGLPVTSEPSPEELAASPAGMLFLERARAVGAGPCWGAEESTAIAQICARLAGIPLGLELAAARLRYLDPATLLARLDDALSRDGARDLPSRQRTMHATLDWSYGLLPPAERSLLRLLSVFSGGFNITDVEAVADAAGSLARKAVLPAMESLVEHSLVVVSRDQGERVRHNLLEPVAEYAYAKLEEQGESEAVTSAYLHHFMALAENAAPEHEGSAYWEWLSRIDDEHANLSAAIRRAIASGQPDLAGRLGWALWVHWWVRGLWLHGRTLVEEALRQPLSDEVRTRATVALAVLAFAQGDLDTSRRSYQAALEWARQSDDLLALANCLSGLGIADLAAGELESAKALFSESLPIARAAGAEAEWLTALTHIWLGTIALLEGDTERAITSIERGLTSARRRHNLLTMCIAYYNLAQVAEASGSYAQARRHLKECVELSMEMRDVANLAYALDGLAVVEWRDGAHERVPVLIGAAQGLRQRMESASYGYYKPDVKAQRTASEAARARLGDHAFTGALETGRSLSAEEAAEFAVIG